MHIQLYMHTFQYFNGERLDRHSAFRRTLESQDVL